MTTTQQTKTLSPREQGNLHIDLRPSLTAPEHSLYSVTYAIGGDLDMTYTAPFLMLRDIPSSVGIALAQGDTVVGIVRTAE